MRVSVFSCGLVVVAAAMLLLLPAVQMQADAFSVYVPAKDEQVSGATAAERRDGRGETTGCRCERPTCLATGSCSGWL